MPKVSFILPAYKRRFLHEAIASILAQTYRDFELVVVDDRSPEGLKEVVDEFHDERLSYHCNEQNLGGKDLVAAWTHAMSFARSEWCVLASDDDVYLPGFLAEMIRLTEKYPQVDVVHARQAMIDGNGKILRIGQPRNEFESQIEQAYNRDILRLKQTAPEFMFRRTALEGIGGFVSTPKAWFTDNATWLALAKNGICCSRDVLFYFRFSGMNITSKSNDVLDKVTAGEQHKEWFKKMVSAMVPANDIEARMKELALEGIDDAVDGVAKMYMSELPFKEWLDCYRKISTKQPKKRGFLYERYPLLLGLRRLFK